MDDSIANSRGFITIGDNASQTFCKSAGCNKLNVCNWLDDIPESDYKHNIVEIRFKNTRKSFFKNVNDIVLKTGDIVAVEASPGHDIGIVSLTGDLVIRQLVKNNIPVNSEFKKIYRKAKPVDIEKWEKAIILEHETMLNSRIIAQELKLDMKIGDVEYQGDGTKAIFYYIADDRVDFRELIKVLADKFKIRIEMKQIGARQEAGRIGGIGSCGRELCCATWITNFVSVTTNAARYQELSLNPQKLAGQCGKLKCCLNFEVDCYMDAIRNFPKTSIALETFEGTAYHQKTDIFKRVMWYSFDKESSLNLFPVPVERVREIISMNKKGKKPKKLLELSNLDNGLDSKNNMKFSDVLEQESINRFEEQKKPSKKRKKRKPRDNRDNRDNRDRRDNRNPKDKRGAKVNRGPKQNQGPRDNRENKPKRDNKEQ